MTTGNNPIHDLVALKQLIANADDQSSASVPVSLLKQLLAAAGPWSETGGQLAAQRYQHYKGAYYELVCMATYEADESPMIVYRAGNGSLWIRRQEVFFEKIELNGELQGRFVPVP